ncbi:MAG: response regulator transcription factor [Bacteroidales bacterium]|nr:response regulator transcription factor [Bacteroidales bacterium]
MPTELEKQLTLFITDDHKIIRDGIKSMLVAHRYIRVTGESGTGQELLDQLKERQPDILILDLVLPDISGVELTRQISKLYPDIRILILTAEMDESTIIETIKNGASGFLNKDISGREFVDAIKRIAEGECYFGQRISGIIYQSYMNKIQNPASVPSVTETLSEREKEIISLLSEGMSFKEVGERLFISPRTVENHKNNILEKLSLRNTIELVKFAIKHGIIILD